jgi:hypothetical protein
MTRTLLATTAAVALVAGMSLAAAQGMKEGGAGTGGAPGASGPSQTQPQKQGGAEKGSRTGQSGVGEKGERTGQKNEEKGERTGQKTEEKNERTGQKNEEKNERTGQKGGEKNERTGQRPDEKNERTGQGAQPGGTSTAGHAGAGKSVNLSSEQKTRIHEVIGRNSSARVDHVDFSLSVGTRVPRTVHVVVLPDEIVRIVPEYRGFKYIIVRDEIVILDPDTLEIVAILPV